GICDYYGVPYIEDDDPAPGPTPEPAPAPAKTISGLPVVKYGSRGDTAKIVQAALIQRGFSCGASGVDGVFGAPSVSSLKSYQQEVGITADGIVGPATWGQLLGV